MVSSSFPWSGRRDLGLPLRPSSKAIEKHDWFLDRINLGRLRSDVNRNHKIPSLDEFGENTYTYCMEYNGSADAPVLATGNEDGWVNVYDASPRKPEKKTFWKAHSNAIFDICWAPLNPPLLVSVSGDRSVRLWDLHEGTAREGQTFVGYQGSVKCVQFAPDTVHTLASGSRDNSIVQWDLRSGKITNCIKDSHSPDPGSSREARSSQTASVTSIRYLDERSIVSCSDLDGIIKVWDLRKSYDRFRGLPKPRDFIPFPTKSSLRGYSSIVLNSAKTKLYASCKDHNVYCFDVARLDDPKPKKLFSGHYNGNKFFIRISLSPDDRYLASGSSDNNAYVWNTKLSGPATPIGCLKGHEADVTCVNFSARNEDPYSLATCSDDFTIRIWSPLSDEVPRDLKHPCDGHFEMMADVESYLKVTGNVDSFTKEMAKNTEKSPSKKRRRVLGPMNLNNSPLSRGGSFDPYPCVSPRKMNVTPKKINNGAHPFEVSPRKLLFASPRKDPFSSPTSNLPDLVKNGRSPHNRGSPKVRSQRKLNWLASMSQQRKMTMGDSPNSPRTPKTPGTPKTPKSSTITKTTGRGRKRKIF